MHLCSQSNTAFWPSGPPHLLPSVQYPLKHCLFSTHGWPSSSLVKEHIPFRQSPGLRHSQSCSQLSPIVCVGWHTTTLDVGANAGSCACEHAIRNNTPKICHFIVDMQSCSGLYTFRHKPLKPGNYTSNMQKRVLFGWIFLAVGLTPALTFLIFGNPQYIVWFSNHTFIILGLALLFRSPFWAFAEFCLGAIPELLWSIDFLSRVFTGNYIWGFTSYMFRDGAFNWTHVYSFQHILFVPAALYAMYLLGGPVKRAWLGSIAQGVIMWAFSFAFSYDFNINCVYHKCIFDLPFYQFTWPLLMLAHVFLIYFVVMACWKKFIRTG